MSYPHFGTAAMLVLTGFVNAQSPVHRPEFAVASVKPVEAICNDSATTSCTSSGTGNGKGYGKYVTLKMLIGLAWQVQPFQISGGPAWVGSDRFDVEGKAEDPNADYAHLRLMIQSLLESRFQLKFHREIQQSPVYALVVAKGGQKSNCLRIRFHRTLLVLPHRQETARTVGAY